MLPSLSLPPLSLYIHIPWCEKKCPYCDFNSHVTADIPEREYIECLKRDLDSQLKYTQGRKLQSIFIGGGTPSLFSATSITEIIRFAEERVGFDESIEITMEANPRSSEQKKFSALNEAGINRISLGIQSFHQDFLKTLGRIHNPEEAINAVGAAKAAGFNRINLDLMHGLPNQTTQQALEDLKQAIDLGVSHISWYQLTIEQNTEFYRHPPLLPVEDTLADIQEQGMALLQNHGFKQYEVSAFAKTGESARHNFNYWQFGDYLAIGAGAHGKISLPESNKMIRFQKTRQPKDYMTRLNDFNANINPIEDPLFEGLMNCLRLNEGMATQDFLAYTGCTIEDLSGILSTSIQDGLIEMNERIKATEQGQRYLNSVLERLLQ